MAPPMWKVRDELDHYLSNKEVDKWLIEKEKKTQESQAIWNVLLCDMATFTNQTHNVIIDSRQQYLKSMVITGNKWANLKHLQDGSKRKFGQSLIPSGEDQREKFPDMFFSGDDQQYVRLRPGQIGFPSKFGFGIDKNKHFTGPHKKPSFVQ